MIDTQNFIVRSSGKVDGRYYIDYIGLYKTADVAKTARIELKRLRSIYLSNGGVPDESQDIYYFTYGFSGARRCCCRSVLSTIRFLRL